MSLCQLLQKLIYSHEIQETQRVRLLLSLLHCPSSDDLIHLV